VGDVVAGGPQAVANPNFRDPGPTPGSAAHWTISSVCQRSRIAAFGPAPEGAQEDFEPWSTWQSELSTFVRAFFDGAIDGFETFEAWSPEVFLVAFTDSLLEACAFAGAGGEDFATGWSGPPALAWGDVASAGAAFGTGTAETFDTWPPAAPPAFASAAFSGSGAAETFEATWPALAAI
jgi:hypothetical protein